MSTKPAKKKVYQKDSQAILPQPVNDPSIIESVAGFIHEVVPQAYSSILPGDTRESILWARFDLADLNDPDLFPKHVERETDLPLPTLLVLGYATGVQVWSISGNGEATELLSWCQGTVRTLRFLLRPLARDHHLSKRPIVAIIDSSSPGPQYSTLSFVSLKTAEIVKIIKFNSAICDVLCNRKYIVVTFNGRIAIFDSATLEDKCTITKCYRSSDISPNPIALGTRWLAYADSELGTRERSSGGYVQDSDQSYTSVVLHAAKSLSQGIIGFGGSLSGNTQQASQNAQPQPGIVSVVDIEKRCGNNSRNNLVAHFVAHLSEVVAMAFDPSGLLLVTADINGRKFNVFRIHPHPVTSQLTAVHHIYVLRRGETTARIQDIAISLDSRWIAVSSEHGTTHVFPITPYGGSVNCRTHVNTDVVNKVSRFERSAGLRDGRGSPLPCSEAPQTPPSPRLPPYPSPNAVAALAQLKARPEDAPLAAIFARPRAWIPGQPRPKRSCSDSLYIIYSSGVFLQYDLVPKTIQSVAKEKKGFDCPIELGVEPKAEWILPKPSYSSNLSPPLPENHVLLELLSLPQPTPDRWLSQVEIMTYTGPSRRLWMGPQFSFSSIDPLPSSGNGGDAATDHIRSNPINIPIKQYFVMEAPFSGSPQLSGSGGLSESGGRLKEDLADAMLETHQSSGQAKGKLRRAEVEWQVNPLGAVQTHPTSLHSNWPHPIFFEQYPEEQYRAVQTPTSQQTVEEAALETIKLEEQSLDSSTPQVLINTSGNIASEEMSVNTDITSSGWSRVSEDTPNLTICPNVRDVSNISSKSNIEEPLKINSGCLSEFTGDLLEDNMQLIDLNSPSVAITSETDPCSYDKFVAIDQSFNKQEIEGKCEEIVLQMQGAEKKQIDETVSRKKETDDNVHIITKEQETKDTADNVISKKKDTEERVGDVESIKQEIEDKVDILLATLSKKPETKDIVDETVSQQQDIEEKPFKPSGKKGRKKRNGNDKKSKKDPVKLIFHETPFQKENIYDPSNENKINQSVGGFTFKEIIEHKIESSLEQDILLTVGDEQPVLACGLIEVTEEISFIKEETINLANEDYTEPEKEVELNVEIVSENTQLPDTKEEGEIIESSHEISSEHPLLEEPIHKEVIILLPEIKSVQIENECTPVKEVLAVEEDRDLNGNNTFPQVSDCTQELLNSNKTDMGVVIEVPIVVPASENKEVQKCDNIENNECEVIESHSVTENIEQEQVEFITIPTKSNRNKNRRKKKEKKLEEISHVAETSEIESSDSNLIPSDETAGPEPEQVEHSSTNEEEIKVLVDYLTGTKDDIDDLLKNVEIPGDKEINYDNNSLGNEQLQLENSIPDSISLTSLDTKSSLALSDNIHSDALTSTEKSEIDESSHSGKESDDSKVDKKERSRKHKRSESSDKDHSDIKKKSPSPIKSKLEVTKDSESSDEAIQTGDVKLSIPKIPKRKKGKKGEDGNPELPIMETKTSHCSSTDVEESHRLVIKEKGSDCSIESNSETKNPKQTINKCLNQPNAGSDPQNGIDDRDSVYESCNDDGASDSLAFESSKEDFDESTSKFTPTEPSSSNTEEKTDSSDKINQPSKKVRKQKKKKR